MSGSAKKKFYTPEEANQALPLVKAIVADIVRQFREVHDRKERLAQILAARNPSNRESESVYSEETAQIEEELEKDIAVLQGYSEELEKLGVELKDYARGLVDFPALMDGREVYLCWHLGEDEIGYWHELDAGFQGRQSLLASSRSQDAAESGDK